MKRWFLIASIPLVILVLVALTSQHRLLWTMSSVTITVDGASIPDARAYESGTELIVHLENDKPQDLYFIDKSAHEAGNAMSPYFMVTRVCVFTRHEPATMAVGFGKLERPDPVFDKESVSFRDWEGRLVVVRW